MAFARQAIAPMEPPAPPPAATGPLADLRFRNLLGAQAWDSLPQAVRRRFGRHLGAGQSASYTGQVVRCEMNAAGWLLAQACRVIGAPLPLERDGGVAAIVTVTEHGASGGQVWTRMYARKRGFPQVIHSAKRFAGPTRLEEYLGHGFGIALTIHATADGIRFASDHYFVELAGLRLRLPAWLAPGALTIDHADRGAGRFTFTLTLRHRLLGTLIRQVGLFQDPAQEHGHD